MPSFAGSFLQISHNVYGSLAEIEMNIRYAIGLLNYSACCNSLQHTTTPQRTADLWYASWICACAMRLLNTLENTATHCNTLENTATHCKPQTLNLCNTLQHAGKHCNTLQTSNPKPMQHTATHCNTLQHTATHCNSQTLNLCNGSPHQRHMRQ